jgi:hypothetical protein
MPRFFPLRIKSRQHSCPAFTLGLSPWLAWLRDNGEYRYDSDKVARVFELVSN